MNNRKLVLAGAAHYHSCCMTATTPRRCDDGCLCGWVRACRRVIGCFGGRWFFASAWGGRACAKVVRVGRRGGAHSRAIACVQAGDLGSVLVLVLVLCEAGTHTVIQEWYEQCGRAIACVPALPTAPHTPQEKQDNPRWAASKPRHAGHADAPVHFRCAPVVPLPLPLTSRGASPEAPAPARGKIAVPCGRAVALKVSPTPPLAPPQLPFAQCGSSRSAESLSKIDVMKSGVMDVIM